MEYLYQTLQLVEIIVLMLLMEKYIFLGHLQTDRKRTYWIIGIGAVCVLGATALEKAVTDISMLIVLLIYAGIVVALEQKKCLSGIGHILPILGIIMSVFMIPAGIGYSATGNIEWLTLQNRIVTAGLDMASILIIVLFLVLGRKWREHRKDLNRGRILEKGEKRILNFSGCCLFIFECIAVSIEEFGWDLEKRKVLMILFVFIIVILDMMIFAMIIQRNQRFQYQKIAELNQYYLNAEIQHFRDYQKSQQETRKVKHDMKNHIYILGQMLENDDMTGAREYIHGLNEKVERIECDIYTGNDIVDAIISEKAAKARERGNRVTVEGRLPLDFFMKPVDLCTIFSNALDNSLEELERQELTKQSIEVTLQRQNEMQMFLFANPCSEKKMSGITSKKDFVNHGFGLMNIKETVERYGGMMRTDVENRSGKNWFILQLLFTEKNHSQQIQNH